MSDQLTTTSYAVLAQVAVRPWSAYELAEQRVRYFRYVWPRAESAIYREVKRLSKMGLLQDTKEYNGRRPRTVYALTDDGRNALRAWLSTPVAPFSVNFEALLRLIVAPLGTKGDIIGSLEQVRNDAQEMLRFAGAVQQEFIEGINVARTRNPHPSAPRRLLRQPPAHRRGVDPANARRDRELERSRTLRREARACTPDDP